MQKLTRSEEEVMRLLWQLGAATVSKMLDAMPENERPPQSTLSSFIRILEKKGFVGHRAYGKTHEYFPLISKNEYGDRSLGDLVRDYFDGSAAHLVSFLAQKERLSATEMAELLKKLDDTEKS